MKLMELVLRVLLATALLMLLAFACSELADGCVHTGTWAGAPTDECW